MNYTDILGHPEVNLWGTYMTDSKVFAVGNEGQTKAYIFIGRRN